MGEVDLVKGGSICLGLGKIILEYSLKNWDGKSKRQAPEQMQYAKPNSTINATAKSTLPQFVVAIAHSVYFLWRMEIGMRRCGHKAQRRGRMEKGK